MTRRKGGRPREPRIMDITRHPRPHVSISVAAEFLGLHEQTVRARIEDGRLPALRDGQAFRISLVALADYQRERLRESRCSTWHTDK